MEKIDCLLLNDGQSVLLLMLRILPKKADHFGHEKEKLELYTDYLISNNSYATATGLSAMLDGDVSHDQVTRLLSERDYTSISK